MIELDYFKLAHKLNVQHSATLNREEVHFRPSPKSISLISLSRIKPELGLQCKAIKYFQANETLPLLLNDIKEIKKKQAPKRPTPEKSLQSWIIKDALQNNNSLSFDKNIKFITSELAVFNNAEKKIVTDILGFNTKTKKLCVIELKSERLRTRLIEQVDNFEKVILEQSDFFRQLLEIHGHNSSIDLSNDIEKIVVWPEARTSPDQKLIELGISEFGYQESFSFKG